MPVVILAGGLGTRISEESVIKPKPMVKIGARPILWHIMKHYSLYGYNNFIICLGYKGYLIKEYFSNYFLHESDVEINLGSNTVSYLNSNAENWNVKLIDTGQTTQTGGRLKRVENFITTDRFCLTYGDGVSNVDLNQLDSFHQTHGKIATLTAIQPEGKFGALNITDHKIDSFSEKPKGDGQWINGGFFMLNKQIFSYLNDGDETIFERKPLEALAENGELQAFHHNGFWKCMDTLKDKNDLNELAKSPCPPWFNESKITTPHV
ncbi:MAG: glucose-1-phosphate cytidylyltransferase [Candidatus Margulisiibacteriota bacterium]